MEYIVTSLADSGTGSLRDAIAQANAYRGDEEVIITISDDLSGKINLSSDLSITRELTINNNSAASVTISGSYYRIKTSADLTMNSMVMDNYIYVSLCGGKLKGNGNTFNSETPIRLENWIGSTEGLFDELTGSVFTRSNVQVEVYSLSGATTLATLPQWLKGYYMNCSVQSGTTLAVEEGVTITGSASVYGTLLLNGVRVEGSISPYPGARLEGDGNVFTSQTPIHLYSWSGSTEGLFDGLTNSVFENPSARVRVVSPSDSLTLAVLPEGLTNYFLESCTVKTGTTMTVEEGVTLTGLVDVNGTLQLNGVRVEGEVYLNAGGRLEGDGNIFIPSKPIILRDWSGSTEELFEGLTNSVFEGASSKIIVRYALGGSVTLGALPQGLTSYELQSCTVESGMTLTVEEGVTITGNVTVKSGAKLQLNGARVEGVITLEPGACLEGDGNTFTSAKPICLTNWSGSTDGVLDGLTNSVFESAVTQIQVSSLSGSATLASLPEGFVSYSVQGCSIPAGKILTVGKGMTITGGLTVKTEGTLQLDGARVEGYIALESGARLVGDGNVFPSSASISLSNWSGSTAGLFDGLTNSVFKGAQVYVIRPSGSVTLTALPQGLTGYKLNSCSVPAEAVFTVEEGATLVGSIDLNQKSVLRLNGARVEGTVYLRQGSRLEGDGCVFSSTSTIRLYRWSGSTEGLFGDLTNCVYENPSMQVVVDLIGSATLGALPAGLTGYYFGNCVVWNGVTLAVKDVSTITGRVTVNSGGTLQLDRICVEGRVQLNSGAKTDISGCDLSKAELVFNNCTQYDVFDLSGNYWGTADIEEIWSRLGDSAQYVTINSILEAPPFGEPLQLDADTLADNKINSHATSFAVLFNNGLDAASITRENVRLLDALGNEVELTGLSVQGKSFVISWDGVLPEGGYRLVLSEAIRDVYGQSLGSSQELHYTCVDMDFSLAENMPLRNTYGLGLTSLSLNFNSELNEDTVTPRNIRLVDARGNTVPLRSIICDGKTVTLGFDALPEGDYHVEISERVTNIYGQSYTSPGNVLCTVCEESGAKVLFWDCRNTVAGNFSYVDIYFDRPMDDASINTGSVHVKDASGQEQKINRIVTVKNAVNPFYRVYFETVMVKGDYTISLDGSVRGEDGSLLAAGVKHTVAVASPDLSVPEAAQVDATVIGRNVLISWNILNTGDAVRDASWLDTVYLCKTEEWDPVQAIVLGRAIHKNETLEQGGTLAGELKVLWDAILPGDYYIFVVTNESGKLCESDTGNNLSPAGKVSLTIPELALGEVSQVTVDSLNEKQYYSFTAQESCTIRIDAGSGTMNIQGAVNALPTAANSIGEMREGALYMDVKAGETYYVVIQPKSTGKMSVEAEISPLSVWKAATSVVASGQENRILIQGTGFDTVTRFYLEDQVGNRFDPTAIEVYGSMSARVTFDLPEGLPMTQLTIKAYQEGTPDAVAAAGFTVSVVPSSGFVQAADLKFLQGMNGESYSGRAGWVWKSNITVENNKPFDIETPLILITDTAEDFALYYDYDDSSARDRSALLLLGGNKDATKGVLSSGERETIDFCVLNYRDGEGSINAYILSPGDQTVISDYDWARYASALRPMSCSDAEWSAWWDDMRPRIGATVADFVSFVHAMQAYAGNAAGSSLADITQKIMQGGVPFVPSQVVSGKLMDSEGNGVADAIIRVYRTDGGGRELVGTTFSDADGAYVLGGLKPGEAYELESSTAFVHEGEKTPVLDLGTISGDIRDLTLSTPELAACVSVSLLGTDGRTPLDAVVYMEAASGERVYLGSDNGAWTAENVETGDYMLHVKAAGYAEVEQKVSVAKDSANSFSAQPEVLCNISGKLYHADGTTPLAGETPALVKDGTVCALVETGADGSYEFAGAATGVYIIQILGSAKVCAEDVRVASGMTTLSVPAASLDMGHDVTGTISGAKAGMAVELRDNSGLSYYAVLKEDGSFCVNGVPAGSYRLYVGGVELDPSYILACGDGEAPVDAGTHAWVQAARIEGTLLDFTDGVQGGIDLYKDGKLVASTVTDAQGRYGFSILQNGTYTVRGRMGGSAGTTEAVTVLISSPADAVTADCRMAHGSIQIANTNDWADEQGVEVNLYLVADGGLVLLESRSGLKEAGRAYTQMATGDYKLVVETDGKHAEQSFTITDEERHYIEIPALEAWGALELDVASPDATVYVYDALTHEAVMTTKADAEGKAVINRLAAGAYTCSVISADNESGGRVDVEVTAGNKEQYTLGLEALGSNIGGAVTGVGANLIQNTTVSAYDENGVLAGVGTVEADGTYRVNCIGATVIRTVVVCNVDSGRSCSVHIPDGGNIPPAVLTEPETPMEIPDPQPDPEPGSLEEETPEEPEEEPVQLHAPTGLSHALSKDNSTVTLAWNGAENPAGTTYVIQYSYRSAKGGAWSTPVSVNVGPATSYTQFVNDNCLYTWKVVASNPEAVSPVSSAVSDFTVDFTAPAAPRLLDPAIQAMDGDGKKNDAILSWAASTDEYGIKGYYVACGTTPDVSKSTPMFVKGTSVQVRDLKDGNHYWWVCAVDENDNTGEWTSGEFFTDVTPPGQATGVFCSGPTSYVGTSGLIQNATFSWNAAIDNVSDVIYEMEVWRHDDLSSQGAMLELYQTVMTKRTSATVTLPVGTYMVKVRAIDEYGNVGEWSPLPNATLVVQGTSQKFKAWKKVIDEYTKRYEEMEKVQVGATIDTVCCSDKDYRLALLNQRDALQNTFYLLSQADAYRKEAWNIAWSNVAGMVATVFALPQIVAISPFLAAFGAAAVGVTSIATALQQSYSDSGAKNVLEFLKMEKDDFLAGLAEFIKKLPDLLAIADFGSICSDLISLSSSLNLIKHAMSGEALPANVGGEQVEYAWLKIRYLLVEHPHKDFYLKVYKSAGGSDELLNMVKKPISLAVFWKNINMINVVKEIQSKIRLFSTVGTVINTIRSFFNWKTFAEKCVEIENTFNQIEASLEKAAKAIVDAENEKSALLNCIASKGPNCTDGDPDAKLPHKTFQSFDPNDIYGPEGAGEKNWIARREMAFQIECENIAKENIAHAGMVTITEQLDEAFDWNTFRLGDMMLGGRYIEVEGDVQSYKGRVDWSDTHGILVDVDASIDLDTGVVTWKFVAIDPESGWPMSDPFKGLLAPNFKSPEGEGLFNYYVTPKETLASGTQFKAEAEIIFDFNDPIDTPTLTYTLDNEAPEAVVTSVARAADGRHLLVQWSGSDVGSGVASYDVYVSVDGGDWELWQGGTQDTKAFYTMQEGGHVYGFFAAARDWAGNAEAIPATLPPEKAVMESPADPVTLQVVSTQAGLTSGGKLRVIVEFSGAAQAAKTWAAALDVRTADGKVDLTKGAFTYSQVTNTLVWEGPAGGATGGKEVHVGLVGGAVLDSQGRAMAGAGWTVLPGADAGKLADSYAAPTLYDYNGDGKLDLLVGEVTAEGEGRVRIYLNTGTKKEAVFSTYTYAALADGSPLTLEANGCQGAIVRMADLTGDGKAEMVIGLADGSVRVFKAAADGTWEDAGELTCNDHGKQATVRVDSRAAVHFADLNGDGLADLLIGAGDGTVALYYNTGSKNGAVFDGGRYLHDADGALDVGNRASVATCDVDGDGVSDLLVGSATGTVYCYRNYGTSRAPLFADATSVYVGTDAMDLSQLTDRVRIDAADVDGDGQTDLVVGMSDGTVRIFYGKGKVSEIGATAAEVRLSAPAGLRAVSGPEDGKEGYSLVEFSWNAVQGEEVSYVLRYRLEGASEYTVVDCAEPQCRLELPDGRYVWSVQAVSGTQAGSCSFWSTTASTVPGIDADLMPVTTKGKKVTFGWPAVEGAYSYVVTVTRADGTGKPTVKKVTKPTLVATLADNFYDWTVTAVTKKGEVLEEMSGRTFQVDSKAPTKVAKLAAAQKEGAEGATAVLTWAAATDVSPVKYVVEYSVKSNFAKGTVTTLETAGLAAALPVEPGKYVYYRVRAVDSFGNMSAWATGKYGEPSIPPTGQKIDSVTGRKVAVSWEAAEGAKSYVISLKNVLTGKVALTKTVKTTNVLLTVPDGEYTWTVQAVSAAGIRSLDVPDGSLLLDLTAPKAVTKLTSARTGEGGMTLTWTAPKDATCLRYVVEYSENADFSAAQSMEVDGTSAAISAAAGAQLYCRVKALDRADNESPWTALGVLTATTKGKVMTLGWAAVAGAASYTVTFTGEDGKTVVKKVKTNALTATLADNVYGWTVLALDKKGQALSEVTGKGFKVDSIAPVKVAGLTATRKAGAVGETAVLTWDASADASDVTYIVEYSVKSNFAKGTVTTQVTADLTAELPVAPGQYIYYRVTAVDSFGNKSKAVGGKYGEPAIAPAELACTVDNKTVTLGWAAVEGAKSYIVTFTNVETGKVTVKTAKTNSLKTAMAVGGYTWTVQTVSAAGIKSDGAEGAEALYIGMAPPPVVDPDYGTLTTAMPAGETLAWLPAASDPLETGAPAAVETVGTGVQTPTGGIDRELALSAGVACTPGTVTGLADTGCVYALEPETEATRRQAMLASPLH